VPHFGKLSAGDQLAVSDTVNISRKGRKEKMRKARKGRKRVKSKSSTKVLSNMIGTKTI